MTDVTRAELIAAGMTDRRIRAAVARGELLRLRPGHYGSPGTALAVRSAVAAGGRLACLSELRHRHVWVLDSDQLHIHVSPHASRIPVTEAHVHWAPLRRPGAVSRGHIGVVDALIQAHGCLGRFAWIASVDSALRKGLIRRSDLDVMARAVREADRRLLLLADGQADSGIETIVRLIALALGFHVRLQVRYPGIGVVDLVIEDWIAVETDGNEFHDHALSARDRRRDALLAGIGVTPLRPGYSLVIYHREQVARQLIGAVESHRSVKDAGRIAARARKRLEKLDLT